MNPKTRRSHTRSQSRFAAIPQVSGYRSQFDRSHGIKTTFSSGFLVPVFLDEILPGDTARLSMTSFCRLATLTKPIMDNLRLSVFFFFVPNRLVWDNWQRFMGEQDNPSDSIEYEVPVVRADANGWKELSLGDYFGLPTKVGNLETNALPFRGFHLVYNEWFRDENLQDSLAVPKDDGPDDFAIYGQYGAAGDELLPRRGKRHDYFSASLPWPQKGDPVTLPLGTTATLVDPSIVTNQQNPTYTYTANEGTFQNNPFQIEVGGSSQKYTYVKKSGADTGTNVQAIVGDESGLQIADPTVDLTSATAISINELREASRVQALLEHFARGGTRYTEILKSVFGVDSGDARLNRPEFLGSASFPIMVNTIAQNSQSTSEGADQSPQANLAGYGTGLGRSGFSKSFVEHGYVIGFVSVRADLSYQQGLHKMWTRKSRYDFYWPEFANLGEQVVESRELYADGTGDESEGTGDYSVFGYQERYAEYRYKQQLITGRFRSNAAQKLDIWHLAQNFSSRPTLNASYIEDNPPVNRIIAVPEEPEFLFDAYCAYRHARRMPIYSVPGIKRF